MFLKQKPFLAEVLPLNLVGNRSNLELKTLNRVRNCLHVKVRDTGTSTICSQILSEICSCGTVLNSSTMSSVILWIRDLHNLLVDPLLHVFLCDQPHHLLHSCHNILHDRRHRDIHHLISDSASDALHKHKLNHIHDLASGAPGHAHTALRFSLRWDPLAKAEAPQRFLASRSRYKEVHHLLLDSVFDSVHRHRLNRLREDLHRHFRLGDLLHKLRHTLPGDHSWTGD